MVFQPEGLFQQFPHCKFRENIVRLLYIPSIVSIENDSGTFGGQSQSPSPAPSSDKRNSYNFLAVNKFGKVGLYHPERFSLLHTYCLDLSVPMHPRGTPPASATSMNNPPTPKCERTHLITDAIFSLDTFCVIFSTTKNILQWYDIGEIQQQNIGLEIFPRKEFMGLYESSFPVTVPNRGYVESHRLFGLNSIPTCLEYFTGRLLVGDVEGGVTIISVPNPRAPLGRRKIRGKLHKLILSDMTILGLVGHYKAHHHPVTDIFFLREKDLILTCSKDKKFSIFVKDVTDVVDNLIVSVPKGVNSLAYSSTLKMIATGSDDHAVRLFNQFIMKMPQMELFGHRSPVMTVNFVKMDSVVMDGVQETDAVILLSYSADSELRAWDPLTFICLQSLYLSFPVGSTIMCKTPEFARKSLLVFQPKDEPTPVGQSEEERKKPRMKTGSGLSKKKKSIRLKSRNGIIILLYCNSYARIPLVKESVSRWPFDYDGFIQEFEELSMVYDKKLKEKLKIPQPSIPSIKLLSPENEEETGGDELGKGFQPKPASPRGITLSKEDVAEIESRLDKYMKEILELKQAIREGNGRPISDHDRRSAGSDTGTLPHSGIEYSGEDESSQAMHLNISVEATNRYYEFKREKGKSLPKNLRRMISYGQAFNQYPTLELEPIEFTKRNLRIPERMKTMLGIDSVNSVQDLGTPEAQAYFAKEHRRTEKGSHSGNAAGRSRNVSVRPSHFAVVGHKMHNVYEEEVSTAPMEKQPHDGQEFSPVLEEGDEEEKFFDFS